MFRSTARFLLSITVLAGSGVAARAGDPTPAGVVDDAGLFRPATVAAADETIRGLRRDYHFDVRIETIASLPEAERKSVGRLMPGLKARRLTAIGRERADKADVNGLYILICGDPAFNEVVAYPKTAESLFSRYQQSELRKVFDGRLHGAGRAVERNVAAGAALGLAWERWPASNADKALLATLDQVTAVLRERAGDPDAVRSGAIAIILAGGMVFWLVLALVRRRMAERNPEGGLIGTTQPDRRPALLAAQFGTPAAHWVYDRLFFGQPPVSVTPTPTPPPMEVTGETRILAEPADSVHPEPDVADAATHDDIE